MRHRLPAFCRRKGGFLAPVAQVVEHRPLGAEVAGANPAGDPLSSPVWPRMRQHAGPTSGPAPTTHEGDIMKVERKISRELRRRRRTLDRRYSLRSLYYPATPPGRLDAKLRDSLPHAKTRAEWAIEADIDAIERAMELTSDSSCAFYSDPRTLVHDEQIIIRDHKAQENRRWRPDTNANSMFAQWALEVLR